MNAVGVAGEAVRQVSSLVAVGLGTPVPYVRSFRDLSSGRGSGISAFDSVPVLSIESRVPVWFIVFGPLTGSSGLLCLLLTSADPSHRLATTLAHAQPSGYEQADRQISQGKTQSFPAYVRRIYFQSFCTGIGLWVYWPPQPLWLPRMRFLFVGPAFCLRLPSDPTSPWARLPFG